MEKIRPKGTNAIISLVVGLSFLSFIPVYLAIFKMVFNPALLVIFLFIIVAGILFCSEFFGNKMVITETSVIVYQWYKPKYFITLSDVTEARLGHFCKIWWSSNDIKVLSAKVFTKDYTIEFPVINYSTKQTQRLMELLENGKKRC